MNIVTLIGSGACMIVSFLILLPPNDSLDLIFGMFFLISFLIIFIAEVLSSGVRS